MGYIYMISTCCFPTQQIGTNVLPEVEDGKIESAVFMNTEGKSIFHHMRRIYQFLDYWKTVNADKALLLFVDSETAKIVNSYFFDVSGKEFEHFSMESGKIYQYSY